MEGRQSDLLIFESKNMEQKIKINLGRIASSLFFNIFYIIQKSAACLRVPVIDAVINSFNISDYAHIYRKVF